MSLNPIELKQMNGNSSTRYLHRYQYLKKYLPVLHKILCKYNYQTYQYQMNRDYQVRRQIHQTIIGPDMYRPTPPTRLIGSVQSLDVASEDEISSSEALSSHPRFTLSPLDLDSTLIALARPLALPSQGCIQSRYLSISLCPQINSPTRPRPLKSCIINKQFIRSQSPTTPPQPVRPRGKPIGGWLTPHSTINRWFGGPGGPASQVHELFHHDRPPDRHIRNTIYNTYFLIIIH